MMPAYLIPTGHPMYYLQRASTNGRHLCAWFCGRVATRFWIKGCLDPESDGIAIRRAFGAVCRNRHDVARSTQSRHPARNHPELAAEMVMERTTLVRALSLSSRRIGSSRSRPGVAGVLLSASRKKG